MQTVSIIIPCKNEYNYIDKCLNSIVYCNYNKSLLTVYICDGNSNDGTINVIKSFAEKYPYFHYLNNPYGTTPFALNMGLQKSTADIKIILGAHSEIDLDFVNNCVSVLNAHPSAGCVGGYIENISENRRSKIIALAMSSEFGVGNAHFRTGAGEGFVDTVAFGAYRKEVFAKIGYFDTELTRNQDDDLNFRLIKAGFKIFLSNKIKSKYYVRGSFKKLFKQYYQYGYWKVYVNKKHKTITTVRQLVPACFVLFLFVFGIGAVLNNSSLIIFISVISIYLAGGIYFGYKKAGKVVDMLQIAYSFFILHLSYGMGYLEGLMDFLIFNKKPKISKATTSR